MYEPPEIREKNHKLSRRYDVWSFGCVLLQFLIWLVKGPDGIQAFLRDFGSNNGESFWQANGKAVTVRPEIKTWMENLSRSIRRKVPPNFQITLMKLLELTQNDLLIVDVNAKSGSRGRMDSKAMLNMIKKIYRGCSGIRESRPNSEANRLPWGNSLDIAAPGISMPLSKNVRQTRVGTRHS